MALGTPLDGGAAYSAQNGTSVSPSYPSGIQSGDCLLLIIGQKPSTANGGTVTTPSGWTLQGSLLAAGGYGTGLGADTGNTNLRIYSKDVVTGLETGTQAVTVGANNICWADIIRIPTSNGALSYVAATGQRTTAPTSALSVTLSPNIQAQVGDKFITAMCIPTDVTTPSQFTNAGTSITGLTETDGELEEPDSATGNDIGGFIGFSHVDAGTATGAPVFTATLAGTLTNVRGPVVTVLIRETAVTRTGDLDAAETGNDTASIDGAVLVAGDLVAAETGADIFSANGTVTDASITGDLAGIEVGADTFTATADLIVKGSLSATETGTDTFSATGDVIVRGSLSATEVGSDTFSAAGRTLVKGSLAAAETGTDTFAASGIVFTPGVSGSLAAHEVGNDTFAASGAVAFPGITGSLAAVETGTDTLSAIAKALVQGSLTAQEVGQDIFAGSGDNVSSGVVNGIETGTDLAVSTGKVLVPGSLNASEIGSDQASFIGIQDVVSKDGGKAADYFRPVREVTVRVEKTAKVAVSARAVKVRTTAQAVAMGWAPGARIKSRQLRVFRGVQTAANGGAYGHTRPVLVSTDFNLKALPVMSGLTGYTSPVQVTTTTAQIVMSKTNRMKAGYTNPTVRTVTNMPDDEMLAVIKLLQMQRKKRLDTVIRKFK